MIILGIETSCDETAISIIKAKGDLNSLEFEVLGSSINSQIKIHSEFGGVVPNLAKREHKKNLPIVLEDALKKAENELQIANCKLWEKEKPKIDLIFVTVGPGLEPALWTGIEFAKELGEKWHIPVIGTNHMEGHIASVLFKNNELEDKKLQVKTQFGFPSLALLISGGHTEIILLKDWKNKEKIGETKDDAVGEAFDKVARMLKLPYPGGPEISRLAEEARNKNIQLDTKFPRPMIHSHDFNFSFSGLKTAVLYYLKNLKNNTINQENVFSDFEKLAIAREFEDAVVETLLTKTRKAILEYLPKNLIIGGGVIANKTLREKFLMLNKEFNDLNILIPEKSLATDNATMIAAAGYIDYLNGVKNLELKAQGNLEI